MLALVVSIAGFLLAAVIVGLVILVSLQFYDYVNKKIDK